MDAVYLGPKSRAVCFSITRYSIKLYKKYYLFPKKKPPARRQNNSYHNERDSTNKEFAYSGQILRAVATSVDEVS